MPRATSSETPLFDVKDADPTGPGPVYQGVAKSIRALADRRGPAKSGSTPAHPDRTEWLDENAGAISAARSLAASIDRVSGHADPKRQASGMQLSSLHASLLAWLERLDPLAGAESDAVWDDLQARFDAEEARHRGSSTPASHPEV